MKAISGIIAAAATGALATYFLDAQQGRRRRAVLRDKVYSRFSHLDDAGRVVALDVRNRGQGMAAGLWGRLAGGQVTDEVLAERVRARLGRLVSHPGSIEVLARQGVVTLGGPILEHEVKRAMRAVWGVRGVQGVEDSLEVHKQAGNVPGLQGGQPREQRVDVMQEHWAPATRLLVGGGGLSMALYGLARRSVLTPVLAAAGIAMAVRAGTNMDARRLLGRRGIDFQKTLHIAAPVEEVFAFWRNLENFPEFMRNVRNVWKNRDDTWHWEVAGPLGTSLRWDAAVTKSIPNELLAWASTPGSQVEHAGVVRFQPDGAGTRLQVQMSYNPPAGAAGHVVASLFGADPGAEMDQDLMRLKAYFETGKPARDAARAPAAS